MFFKNGISVLTSQEKAAKEAFDNNIHHHYTMKIISKACLRYHQVFCLGGSLPYFVNTSLPTERLQVLLPEKKNFANFQNIALIFLKHQILIAIWRDQGQHSVMENAVF